MHYHLHLLIERYYLLGKGDYTPSSAFGSVTKLYLYGEKPDLQIKQLK